MAATMPALFVGHGNPLNALYTNSYTRGWEKIGRSLRRPSAILSISAHWYIPRCAVMANAAPRTIHDFGGFPQELYDVHYPAPGSPGLAERVKELLAPVSAELDESWGLDHGTWSVLKHLFPDASIPVVQLSIDERQPAPFHYALGKRLLPLRDEGVLLLGSGNLVHNLHSYAWGEGGGKPYEWAARFEERVRELLVAGDDPQLVSYEELGRDAMLSVPTPDHYLPLLYVLGARKEKDRITFPVEGVDGGSVSMLAVRMG
ncbi:4,5-DOPA dioxygenase extradiol [Geomonas sp. RF6]|uniref:4,5-DOPA-extradiol-dioxygenase n=1 Tax=Geomonas sp. RF6 TaxID=2897342 RepID=UPI001E516902|nr:4,5-DOPA dioxygenase extradiol [Geomonas sp. RF6]UFS70455.1 4,5-DOPA dioxygenase extradiol [Geomonas sp. RF6]